MKFAVYILTIFTVLFSPILALAKTPNDPYFAQWSFEDTGVYTAWDYTTGSKDVVVAIIDNGFDTFHPDLKDNLWVNQKEVENNGIDDDQNGYIDDYYGWNFLDNNNDPKPNVETLTSSEKEEGVFNHATFVAGIIGAKGNNAFDGAGINWDVRLMNLKVIGNNGVGDFEPLVKAIHYAVENGANVINISMVGEGNEEQLQGAIDYAYQHNVLVVAAAGNNMLDLNYSGQYPVCSDEFLSNDEILGVSAIDQNHHLAFFSNIGSKCIDITAPGVGIRSTLLFSPTNGLSDSYSVKKSWNGTSFAAPFVSGAAALLKSIKPSLTVSQIIDTLLSTVHHTPSDDEVVYANLFGSGLLQIDKAVKSIFSMQDIKKPADNTSIINIKNDKVDSILKNTDVALVSSKTGKKEIVSKNLVTESRDIFGGLEDVFLLQNSDGIFQNVTLSSDENGQKVINFYDDNLRFLKNIELNLFGNYDLAVGYISEDLRIVLSPKDSSDVYFYIFDDSGKLLKTYRKDVKHEGASVYVENGNISLAYVKDNKTNLEVLDYSLNVQTSFAVNNILAGQLMVLDLDNNGSDEYMLSARAGSQAWFRVFNNKGLEVYNIRVYPSLYKSGFHFAVADYNGDGSLDFVFTPTTSDTPVVVTSLSGELITGRFPFNNVDYGQVFTMFVKNK